MCARACLYCLAFSLSRWMSEFPHSTPSAMFPGASIAIKCRLLQNYFTAVVRFASNTGRDSRRWHSCRRRFKPRPSRRQGAYLKINMHDVTVFAYTFACYSSIVLFGMKQFISMTIHQAPLHWKRRAHTYSKHALNLKDALATEKFWNFPNDNSSRYFGSRKTWQRSLAAGSAACFQRMRPVDC